MERRNDSTWLFVGVGVGCSLVLMLSICVGAGALWYLTRDGAPRPPPTSTPPMPPMTVVPPPVLPPPVLPPPVLPPAPLPPGTSGAPDGRAPLAIRATISSVTGTPGASVGQTCEFNVERRDSDDGSGFWCNAQVVCGGHLLYGGPTAGFFPCTLVSMPRRSVIGSDPTTTAQDQDAALRIDTPSAELEIWDDARGANGEFHVVAHIDSVE